MKSYLKKILPVSIFLIILISFFTEIQPVVPPIVAILAGASWGDHCSPISDTTIMSSMTCASDHIDHVRTQMPYALTTAFAAMVFGYIPIGFGLPPFISWITGFLFLIFFINKFGKRVQI